MAEFVRTWKPFQVAKIALCAIIAVSIPTKSAFAKDGDLKSIDTLVKKRIKGFDSIQINKFSGDFTGDGRPDVLVISYYHDRDGGNSESIDVSLYEGTAGGFRYLKTVPNVFGESPWSAKFSRGQVRVTLTTLGPNDARCCPSVPKEYVIATP